MSKRFPLWSMLANRVKKRKKYGCIHIDKMIPKQESPIFGIGMATYIMWVCMYVCMYDKKNWYFHSYCVRLYVKKGWFKWLLQKDDQRGLIIYLYVYYIYITAVPEIRMIQKCRQFQNNYSTVWSKCWAQDRLSVQYVGY